MRRDLLFPQVLGDGAELLQRGLQIVHDLGGQHVRLGQVGRLLQRLVAQLENVEVDLVACCQLINVISCFIFRPLNGCRTWNS